MNNRYRNRNRIFWSLYKHTKWRVIWLNKTIEVLRGRHSLKYYAKVLAGE